MTAPPPAALPREDAATFTSLERAGVAVLAAATFPITDAANHDAHNIRLLAQAADGHLKLATAAHADMLAALKAVCGVFDGQDDVPMYVRKARAAIQKAGDKP